MSSNNRPWFAAKRIGVGSSWPITWQGWGVLAAFLLGVAANALLLHGLIRAAAVGLMVVALGLICAVKTDGGWRWRWP